MGNWWGHLWIWAALGLLILMAISMSALGSRPFNHLRKLAQGSESSREKPVGALAANISADDRLAALPGDTHPLLLTVIGGGGLALILWLMLFKPF